jgi:FMN hydrolase / 5-amino-6-(5-phospho-D-ribitylamino)uracil phosphatase
MTTRAIFFDVDFTLIFPGPTFQGEGYQAFCRAHGMTVDAARFAHAVVSAAPILDAQEDSAYDGEVFVAYIRHIIEQMGGDGATIDACSREIYREWATNHHFEMYDDTAAALEALSERGLRIGLISNSHRCLNSFQSHFELQHLVGGAISSAQHGFMKPCPSIFQAAMQIVGAEPAESVMVGDSIKQDVEGALRAGMRAIFLHRNDEPHPREAELLARGVRTIRSLAELPDLFAS